MNFRIPGLENGLTEFVNEINKHIETPVTVEMLVTLFFARSGSIVEHSDQCVYLLNRDGLSVNSQNDLNRIIKIIIQMGIEKNGKPVIVKLKLTPS